MFHPSRLEDRLILCSFFGKSVLSTSAALSGSVYQTVSQPPALPFILVRGSVGVAHSAWSYWNTIGGRSSNHRLIKAIDRVSKTFRWEDDRIRKQKPPVCGLVSHGMSKSIAHRASTPWLQGTHCSSAWAPQNPRSLCVGRGSHVEGSEQNATQFLNSVRGLATRQGCRRNQFVESKECLPRSRPTVSKCRIPTAAFPLQPHCPGADNHASSSRGRYSSLLSEDPPLPTCRVRGAQVLPEA